MHMHACVHIHTCITTRVCADAHVCVCTYTYVCINTRMHTHSILLSDSLLTPSFQPQLVLWARHSAPCLRHDRFTLSST